ncbi:MAG: hypothetical protein EXR98_15920 [Gemmataceae bacterium]|nr:hypothetical protein [Gemmataceae bacterium]
MPIDAICPECEKPLRLRDELAGKKIKCPKCSHPFVVPDPANETIPIEAEEESPRPKKTSKRRSDDDDDDDDDDRPRKRQRSRDAEQVSTPREPIFLVTLAMVFPCGPIGIATGGIAYWKARGIIAALPDGERGASARRNMKIVCTLAHIANAVSIIVILVALTLRLLKFF